MRRAAGRLLPLFLLPVSLTPSGQCGPLHAVGNAGPAFCGLWGLSATELGRSLVSFFSNLSTAPAKRTAIPVKATNTFMKGEIEVGPRDAPRGFLFFTLSWLRPLVTALLMAPLLR